MPKVVGTFEDVGVEGFCVFSAALGMGRDDWGELVGLSDVWAAKLDHAAAAEGWTPFQQTTQIAV
jgi:hypothetical protein